MYKEMIPANTVARGASSRSAMRAANAFPVTHGSPISDNALIRKELTECQERCLRLAADFDNFKKRTARESAERAMELRNEFVRALLPVVDNLERALTKAPAHATEQLREGVQLTLRQLMQVLKQHGFVAREDLGRPFDPRYHEAVSVRSEPGQPDQTILEEWQRSWLHGKTLLRPAKVVVNDLKRSNQTEQEENISIRKE